MTELEKKYQVYRRVAKDGDIILFRGTNITAKGIRYFDDAYYTHTAVTYWNRQRLEVLDANAGGVQKHPMSKRIKKYKNGDFCVIRPKVSPGLIETGINHLNNRWYGLVRYHFFMLLRIAIIKKLKIDLTGISKRKDRTICSFLSRDYANILGMKAYQNVNLITPQDFMRYANDHEVTILFHNEKK